MIQYHVRTYSPKDTCIDTNEASNLVSLSTVACR